MKINDRYCSFYYELDDDYGEISFERDRTALLIVDMQNYFLNRPKTKGMSERKRAYYAKWEPFYNRIDSVVLPNNQHLLAAFREKGMLVCHARITSQLADGRDRSIDQKATGFNELLLPMGSPEAEITPSLSPIKDEIVVMKTTDSAVSGTSLRLMLHNCGIQSVVVTGVFTDQCVSGTVRSLADESFSVWLIEDACAAATQEIQEHELKVLNNIYCHVINTDEVLKNL
ncbi:MAG: isochorismatase [Dethiosulfovibrio peptidovorans]|nr:MAG: isochorismatase [Dethiosulfovibrio peptidovorans]